jgi:long-subunit fatty acid transport protein
MSGKHFVFSYASQQKHPGDPVNAASRGQRGVRDGRLWAGLGIVCLSKDVRSLRLLLIAVLLAMAGPTMAGPLDDPHVGSMGFSGPTTGDLAAIYWNPAALGLIKGYQLMLGGGLRSTRVTVDRAGIDQTTGQPFPSASGRGLEHPVAWPLGPTGFWGAGIEVAGRFAIGVAGYTPFSQKLKFDTSASTHYHLVNVATRHHAVAAALAIQITDWLQVGVAPGLLLSYGHLVFDEDTSGGAEDPSRAARYDLATRGSQAPAYFVAAGIHYRHAAWDIGFSYTSAPLGTDGQIKLAMEQTRVTPPQSAKIGSLCGSPDAEPCVFSEMRYRLPEMFTAGATWQATPRLAVTGMARWLRYSTHDDIDLRLVGPSGGTAWKPADHLRLYRGFQDSWDWRARVVHAPFAWWRWSGTLRMETSAIPTANVNPAAVDGFKIEPILATEFSLGRHLRLETAYALEWMLPVSVDHSVFDPSAAVACTQAQGDLTAPSCQARRAGQARPSAAGRYTMLRHTLALMATVSF